MAGGFKWTLDWDTNPLKRGGQQAATALENAIDTFGDLAREADKATGKAGDALGDDVKDGERTAEKALSDLEDAFRETARKAQESTRDTGSALGKDVKDGTSKASESVQSFKEESIQNFSEVASSFSGDMSQAADGVQGILGGLASAIPGPVGLMAGLLAGIGGAMLASFQTNAAASEQVISDMYDDMKERASTFLSESYYSTAIDAIVGDPKKFQQARDIVDASGAALSSVLRGMAGDAQYATQVQAALDQQTQKVGTATADAAKDVFIMSDAERELYDKQQALSNAQKAWDGIVASNSASLDTARGKVEAYNSAVALGDGTVRGQAAAVDALSDAVKRVPAGGTVKLTVDDTEVRRWAANPVVVNAVARVGRPQVS